VGVTGLLVGVAGALVGAAGVLVGAPGLLVGTTGLLVGVMGALVGATGLLVGVTTTGALVGTATGTATGAAAGVGVGATGDWIGASGALVGSSVLAMGGAGARVGLVTTDASVGGGVFWAIGDVVGDFVSSGGCEPSARMVGTVMGGVCGGGGGGALEMVNVTRYGVPLLGVAVMVCEPAVKSRQRAKERPPHRVNGALISVRYRGLLFQPKRTD
jgi:hypothetical protein